jgi:hypothetical protein
MILLSTIVFLGMLRISLPLSTWEHTRGEWTEKMARNFDTVHRFEPNYLLYNRLVDRFRDEFNVTIYNNAILDVDSIGSLVCDEITKRKIEHVLW